MFYSREYFASLKTNLQIACIFTPLNIFTSLKTGLEIGFSSDCTKLFFVGVGWEGGGVEGKIKKKPKMADFCHFWYLQGVCGGRTSDRGRARCPIPPMSPLFCFVLFLFCFCFCFFFSEQHQTLHDLSLAICMHGNEMILLIHSV